MIAVDVALAVENPDAMAFPRRVSMSEQPIFKDGMFEAPIVSPSRLFTKRSGSVLFPVIATSVLTFAACARHGGLGPCPSLPTDPSGAFSGPLSLSGHITDQGGAAVVGEIVTLTGTSPASRSTDFAGGYLFHPTAAPYSLTLSSEQCSFSPTSAGGTISLPSGTGMQDFTATSNDCATATSSNASSSGAVLTIHQGTTLLGTTKVNITAVSNANAAAITLNDIVSEITAPACSLLIAGKPAIERRAILSAPGPTSAGGQAGNSTAYLAVTTAIGLETAVVRFESQLDAGAPEDVVNLFVAAGRAFIPSDFTSP